MKNDTDDNPQKTEDNIKIEKKEDIEAAGDIINVQDFTTGERVQALVEKVSFTRKTPPSARYDGFGGLLTITVRTVL